MRSARWRGERSRADRSALPPPRGGDPHGGRARRVRRAGGDARAVGVSRDLAAAVPAATDHIRAGLGRPRAKPERHARAARRSGVRRGADPLQHALRFDPSAGCRALRVGRRRPHVRGVRRADRSSSRAPKRRPQLRRMVDRTGSGDRHGPAERDPTGAGAGHRRRGCAAHRHLRGAPERRIPRRELRDRRDHRARPRWGRRRDVATLGSHLRRPDLRDGRDGGRAAPGV